MYFLFVLIFSAVGISYVESGKCSQNEVYSSCGPPIESCCDSWATPPISKQSCHEGCFCLEGHVRNKNNKCIKISDCPKPPKCPKNERFSQFKGNVSSCDEPKVTVFQKPGCYCIESYVRNNQGICIPWKECPCSDPYEIYTDCVPKYPKTCENRSTEPKHSKCLPESKGCTCKPGYVVHDKYGCILEKDCSLSSCQIKCIKENATSVPCVKNIYCDMVSNSWDGTCKRGCQCNPGYARDASDKCIPLKECFCKNNSTFKLNAAACPKTCANSLSDRCDDTLPAGCECDPGYVLNSQGDCILLEECKDEEIICPNNLIYSSSGYRRKCEDIDKMIKPLLTKGCVCPDELYYRNDTKICVLKQECPNSPENLKCQQRSKRLIYKQCQYPGCIKTCNNPHVLDCTRGRCDNGCYCKDGYIQQSYTDKTCVKLENCECSKNASYKTCGKAISDSCERIYQRGLFQIELCVEKCECDQGYYLNSRQQCVLEKDCLPSEIKCNNNLVLTLTKTKFWTCGANRPEIIERGCICQSGYHYDSYRNLCVHPAECTYYEKNTECALKDLNKEYFDNGSFCVATCDDPSGTECTLTFSPGCYCKAGMVQLSPGDDTCMLPSKCPSYVPACFNNTIPTFAGYRHYCSQNSLFIKNECICPNGLKFDEDKAICVDPRECPTSPENLDCFRQNPNWEFRGCQSSSCVPTCSNPTFEICTMDCQSGCFCKNGFLRVSNTNTSCVLPEECLITNCGVNSHYSTCASCPASCSTLYLGLMCPMYCNGIPTCVCNSGYALTKKGTCVLEENCPVNEINCPGNLIYSGSKCNLNNCGQTKPEVMQRGCICSQDQYYDSTKGLCVFQAECPESNENKFCTRKGIHKEYRIKQSLSCIATCDNPFPTGCGEDYKRGCYCKFGMLQISRTNTTCVLPEQCPQTPRIICENNMVPTIQGLLQFCTSEDPEVVNNGCICPDGMIQVSKQNRTCIPQDICTPRGSICNTNMIFQPKGRLYYCGGKVSSWMYQKCICKSNFRFDELKSMCVPPLECTNSKEQLACQKQDINKEYSECSNAKCYPTCELPNPSHCSKECQKGCHCKPGYIQVSETDTRCVLPGNCPSKKCKANASLKMCTSSCPKSCANMHLPLQCNTMCETPPRCECNNGYVLNSNKDCIPEMSCKLEEIKCPENMVYDRCHGCERNCNNLNPVCTLECRIGCFCKKGYVEHKPGGVCIPEEFCSNPDVCSKDEDFVKCQNCCPNTCKNLFHPAEFCTQICKVGCDCKSGLVRNSQGKCISPDKCETREIYCPANMYFTLSRHRLETCQPSWKHDIAPIDVPIGCICNKDLVYDQVRKACVRKTMCTNSEENQACKRIDPNSQYSTFPMCPKTCFKRSPICHQHSDPGCECLPGFILTHDHGICIAEKDCPTVDPMPCSTNATQVQCRNTCPDTCINILSKKPRVCSRICSPGCDCKQGFVQDSNGNCIRPEDCQTQLVDCNDPHALYTTCGGCHRTCSNRNPICNKMCRVGCFCKTGYLVDDMTGLCIPENYCPPETSCPANSNYMECKDTCPKTCSNMYQDILCFPSTSVCTKGCSCNQGYVLNLQGLCVLPQDCPLEEISCPGQMHFSNILMDLETCQSRHLGSLCTKSHCICDLGLVYDIKTQSCIDLRLCTNSPQNQECSKLDPYAIYSLKHPCPQVCTDLSPTQKECTNSCICQPDYVLGTEGSCIPYQKCPISCPKNSKYRLLKTCGRTCDTYLLLPILLCPIPTTYGCDCDDGYVQNSVGQCILPEQCLDSECKLKDLNSEYLQCGGCQGTCSNKYPICNKMCHQGCFCRSGYTLDDVSRLCIPESSCSNCPQNSRKVECINKCFPTCKTMNHPDSICFQTKECKEGCECNNGFVINSKGVCVKPEDCSPEEITCPLNMKLIARAKKLDTCESYFSHKSSKSTMSKCICNRGLVYDSNVQYCVQPDLCPNSPDNQDCQAYDPHAIYSLTHKCERPCTDLSPYTGDNCGPGCICKSGYVRGVDNTCILTSDCPVYCGPHATYSNQVDSCANCQIHFMADSVECISLEQPGCNCDEGYIKNSEGNCVLINHCKPEGINCPPNLHLEKCFRARTCKDLANSTRKLRLGCFCEEPLIYNPKTGLCIIAKLCPNSNENKECARTDINSEYSQSHVCEQPCSKHTLDNEKIKKICYDECICKAGYIRNWSGVCIKLEECLKSEESTCGPNAKYENKVEKCGRTCDSYHWRELIRCAAPPDVPGCNCKKDYVFNKKDECILVTDCTVDELSCPGLLYPDRSDRPATCDDIRMKKFDIKTDCFCNDKKLVYDRLSHTCVDPYKC